MQVRAGLVLLGLAAVAGLAWFAARDPAEPSREQARQQRAARASAQIAADAVPSLYRWRDDAGVLQVTQDPPKDRKYERIPRDAPARIEVDGRR